MQAETADKLATAVATGGTVATPFAVALGVTPMILAACIAAATLGAFASLHFEEAAKPSSVWRLLAGIAALAFLGVLLAFASPSIPLMGWTEGIHVIIRSGLLGVGSQPAYSLIRSVAAWATAKLARGA